MLASATHGEWHRHAGYRDYSVRCRFDPETVRIVATCGESIQDMRDATFIAAAPRLIRAFIAELEAALGAVPASPNDQEQKADTRIGQVGQDHR